MNTSIHRVSVSTILALCVLAGGCTFLKDKSSRKGRSVLEGNWKLACYPDPGRSPELDANYSKVILTFAGGKTGHFRSIFSTHRTAKCDDPAISGSSGTVLGTYIIGNERTSTRGLIVKELDLTRNAITPMGDATISPVLDRPLVLDIIYIDKKKLYFGVNDNPGADPPLRGSTIDLDRPFTR